MQVNNVNQQTNFGSAYAKVNGKWRDLSFCTEEVPGVVKIVYDKALTKTGLLLNLGKIKDLPVVLTDEEAKFFNKSGFRKQVGFLKLLLEDLVNFNREVDKGIEIASVKGNEFIA